MAVMEQNRRNRLMLGQDNNALTWLIIINAVIFILINFIRIIYQLSYQENTAALNFFNKQILDWFTFSFNADTLASRPWTLLSYMFTHQGIWHFISSMLWLWSFGYILQDLTGNNKLVPIYLYGGVAGAIFFFATLNVFPPQQTESGLVLSGAGASVMAIAIATTTLAPDYKIFPMLNGGIPLWVLTLIFVAIDFATIGSSSNGYAAAHLAGAAMGFLFVKQLRRGNDWSEWMGNFLSWLDGLFNPNKKKKVKKPVVHQQHFYKPTRKPFEKTPHITQQKLDEILDKINQKGYHLLTDEEKDFLKKASQEDF